MNVCVRDTEREPERGGVWDEWHVSISSVGNPSRKPQPSPPTWAEELWGGPFTDPNNSPSQTRSRVDAGKGDQRKESWWKGIPYVSKNQALGIGKDAISERQRETGKTSKKQELDWVLCEQFLFCLKLMPTRKGLRCSVHLSFDRHSLHLCCATW